MGECQYLVFFIRVDTVIAGVTGMFIWLELGNAVWREEPV